MGVELREKGGSGQQSATAGFRAALLLGCTAAPSLGELPLSPANLTVLTAATSHARYLVPLAQRTSQRF